MKTTLINSIKELGTICEKLMYIAFANLYYADLKGHTELIKKLEIINPEWIITAPTNTKELLELLIEIHSLGVTPNTINRLLK